MGVVLFKLLYKKTFWSRRQDHPLPVDVSRMKKEARLMNDKFHIRSRPDLCVLRSINDVAVFVRAARHYGIDARELLAGSGIEIGELDDPHRIITAEQEIMVGRRLAQLAPVPWIGLELGQYHHLISKGKLGMAAMCCETVRDAIKLMLSYIELSSTYVQFDVTVKNNLVFTRIKELVHIKDFRRFMCETEIVSMHTICTLIMDDINVFKEVHLAYTAPDYAAKYEEIFHCPVVFDAPEHLIIFDAALLDKPMKLANFLTRKVLEQECRQLCQRLKEQKTIKDKIRHELLFIGTDFPTLDQLARRINMPERTIRRKLTMEGTSYKDILAEIRKNHALELIQTTDFSMDKIAGLLCYSDVASFYHAFKAWSGTTPASFRKKNP
jgi:AraC-like DNA-binding protein